MSAELLELMAEGVPVLTAVAPGYQDAWAAFSGHAAVLPADPAAVRAAHRPSDIELLDRRGEPLQVLRVDSQVRRGPWVSLAELSPAMREAIVLSEDKRFWQHSGIDWRALAGSAWANAWNRRTRGASTVTMGRRSTPTSSTERPKNSSPISS